MNGPKWLDYRQAAKRVDHSVTAIKRWRRQGMPMGLDGSGRRIIREDVLLTAYRQHLQANPAHQYRMRKLRAEHPEQFDTPTL